MAKTYRVAIIGAAHSHVGSLAQWFAELPDAELVAVADIEKDRAQGLADKHDISAIYEDHEALLAGEEIDIALCCSENSRHLSITRAAVKAGCHVIVEKPMAASFEGAHDMLTAARAAEVTLMVNWPSAWSASYRKMAQLVADGAVGQVFCIRTRFGHGGPVRGLPPEERAEAWWHNEALGGGVLLDFCCYGVNLSRWLLAQSPVAVTGMADRLVNDFGDVEDNAVILVRYPGAICTFEATWTQMAGDGGEGMAVFGSEGTLIPSSEDGKDGVLLRRSNHDVEFVPGDELSAGHRNGPEHLIHCLNTGEDLCTPVTPELNVEVMAVLEAGEKAAKTGQLVKLPKLGI